MKIDFKEYLNKRPLSYSSINSFEYDKESWFENYILGIKQTSREMAFGSEVDKKLETDPSYLPQIVRCPLLQHSLKASLSGIPLVGKPDALDLSNPMLRDYKTGKKKWDQKRADETEQLTMYLLLIFIVYKIPPERFECYIDWMPTMENADFSISFIEPIEENIRTFKTKRTMRDILVYGKKIKEIVKEMELFIRT